MTESNWRELCEELTGWIERSTRHYISDPDVLTRARAALRAAAEQGENLYDPHEGKVAVVRVEQLLAIASELEAHHG